MSIKLLLLYFFLGGTIISAVSYFGSASKGLLAGFIATLPSISMITLCIVYINGGAAMAASYFRGMLFMAPVWVLYVLITWQLLPRIGLVPSLVIGVSTYVILGFLIVRFVR